VVLFKEYHACKKHKTHVTEQLTLKTAYATYSSLQYCGLLSTKEHPNCPEFCGWWLAELGISAFCKYGVMATATKLFSISIACHDIAGVGINFSETW